MESVDTICFARTDTEVSVGDVFFFFVVMSVVNSLLFVPIDSDLPSFIMHFLLFGHSILSAYICTVYCARKEVP